MSNFLQQIVQASKVGVPLVGISTTDQRATINKILTSITNAEEKPFSFISWNCIDGCVPNNNIEEGAKSASAINDKNNKTLSFLGNNSEDKIFLDAVEMLTAIRNKLDQYSIVFVHNAHLFLHDNNVVQAIWNLRNTFKTGRKMLILLAPDFKCPSELKDDIVVYDDPLPTNEEIMAVVNRVETRGIKTKIEDEVKEKCVDALLGLSEFAAEQAIYLSLKKENNKMYIDLDQLSHQKRSLIRQTPGLRITDNPYGFNDIGGVEVIKDYMRGIIHGRKPPKLIVFIDEIEKALAGSTGGDNTGVSQDLLGQMLQNMENTKARGIIFVGPPGTSKTLVAKAFGKEAGVDTVEFDLGAIKQAEVGSSEKNIRQALKVITSCSRGNSYWIATSNNLSVIPPELRRRFTDGIFFFDLPAPEERSKIWDIQATLNNLDAKQMKNKPDDNNWTGAEIRNCCAMAWDRNISLTDAAKFINPVAVSSATLIDRLRREASGKFLSASKLGHYQFANPQQEHDVREVSL